MRVLCAKGGRPLTPTTPPAHSLRRPQNESAARRARAQDTIIEAGADLADQSLDWPSKSMMALRNANVMDWSIPAEYGGAGLKAVELLDGHRQIATACMTTAFILTLLKKSGSVVIAIPPHRDLPTAHSCSDLRKRRFRHCRMSLEGSCTLGRRAEVSFNLPDFLSLSLFERRRSNSRISPVLACLAKRYPVPEHCAWLGILK